MSRLIMCIEDMYFEYSTGCDAPVSEPMPLEKFREYYLENEARDAKKELEDRLSRVREKGVSAYDYGCWQDAIICNRAGENENHWPEESFVEWVKQVKEKTR